MTVAAPVLLLEPLNRQIVELCIPRERTLSDLTEQLRTEMNGIYYRVQRLLRAGILKISRTEKRAGRPIKHYQATDESFFVAFRNTPYEDMAEYCHGLTAPSLRGFWESAFQKAQDLPGEWGLSIAYSHRRQSFMLQIQRETDHGLERNPIEQWATENHILGTFDQLRLAPEQAEAMYQELIGVYRKYTHLQDPEARPHWVGLFFAEKNHD
ncbi:winged helix-turn-helix domain-containing protein [Deinococcus cellulosilyticus]|uniref:Uncharacterized protein n=1 Tax=Deinococcus cellulosilyticus (strain DSM 18568 / NBRC 106333 / KACC 11606 / 5516J-15) TaxID=1223518 RepID=A0A511N3K9_DEIC1|nr:helix-turn-helix domain-containing protein [Deinococcus cellulosilyticus]GEM46971.1 hypothetical protein DC3_26060 [Deinococcus cellulosilyticus NBRC 106333 = KACC 11606]